MILNTGRHSRLCFMFVLCLVVPQIYFVRFFVRSLCKKIKRGHEFSDLLIMITQPKINLLFILKKTHGICSDAHTHYKRRHLMKKQIGRDLSKSILSFKLLQIFNLFQANIKTSCYKHILEDFYVKLVYQCQM